MGLFNRKKPTSKSPPQAPSKTTKRRRKPSNHPLEVKLLALDAIHSGLTQKEVSEILDVSPMTISSWRME